MRFGVGGALRFSTAFHVVTVLCLFGVGYVAGLGVIYWLGCLAVSAVLLWEHRIVTPTDLSRINKAFFDFNAYVSVGYFLSTLADLLISSLSGIG